MNIPSLPISSPRFGAKKNNRQGPQPTLLLIVKKWKEMDNREAFVRELEKYDMDTADRIRIKFLANLAKKYPQLKFAVKDGVVDVLPVVGDVNMVKEHYKLAKTSQKMGLLHGKLLLAMLALFGMDLGFDVAVVATSEVPPAAVVIDMIDGIPLAAVSRALLEKAARRQVDRDRALKDQLNQKNGWSA